MPEAHQTVPPVDDASLVQGKWVILGVLGISLAASLVSWVYYSRLQQRPLALWGSDAAELMLRAPQARAYRLTPVVADDGSETEDPRARIRLSIGVQAFTTSEVRDVSRAPGFSHIRQSLIHDRSFVWEDEACPEAPRWDYAVEFIDGERTTTVAFAFNCPRAALANTDRTVSILPVASAIADFLKEQFPPEAPPTPAP